MIPASLPATATPPPATLAAKVAAAAAATTANLGGLAPLFAATLDAATADPDVPSSTQGGELPPLHGKAIGKTLPGMVAARVVDGLADTIDEAEDGADPDAVTTAADTSQAITATDPTVASPLPATLVMTVPVLTSTHLIAARAEAAPRSASAIARPPQSVAAAAPAIWRRVEGSSAKPTPLAGASTHAPSLSPPGAPVPTGGEISTDPATTVITRDATLPSRPPVQGAFEQTEDPALPAARPAISQSPDRPSEASARAPLLSSPVGTVPASRQVVPDPAATLATRSATLSIQEPVRPGGAGRLSDSALITSAAPQDRATQAVDQQPAMNAVPIHASSPSPAKPPSPPSPSTLPSLPDVVGALRQDRPLMTTAAAIGVPRQTAETESGAAAFTSPVVPSVMQIALNSSREPAAELPGKSDDRAAAPSPAAPNGVPAAAATAPMTAWVQTAIGPIPAAATVVSPPATTAPPLASSSTFDAPIAPPAAKPEPAIERVSPDLARAAEPQRALVGDSVPSAAPNRTTSIDALRLDPARLDTMRPDFVRHDNGQDIAGSDRALSVVAASEPRPSLALPEPRSAIRAPDAAPASPPVVVTPAAALADSAGPIRQDVAALVDRIVEARAAARPIAVDTALAHPEFGRVELRFVHDAAGMTVAVASRDPEFGPAIQAAAATSQSGGAGNDDRPGLPRQDAAWAQPPQGAAFGQSQSQGSSRNADGSSNPQQARAQSTSAHDNPADRSGMSLTSPDRGGIYA